MSTSMMEGRSAEALVAARDTVSRVPVEMLRAMPGFDLVLAHPVWTMARFGRWDDLLNEPAPPADFTFATGMWHAARGLALAATRRLDDAAREAEALAAAAAATPADATEANNSARALLAIASDLLAGEIASKRGETDEAIRRLKEAVRGEDALRYNEPSDWPYPVRHSLGAMLLMAGRVAEAEAVYRADLERNPENGWALFGLATSLRVQKKTDEAERARQRFEAAWKNADIKLTASRF
jgi:tetratricopeptide (TPR) repeat protein